MKKFNSNLHLNASNDKSERSSKSLSHSKVSYDKYNIYRSNKVVMNYVERRLSEMSKSCEEFNDMSTSKEILKPNINAYKTIQKYQPKMNLSKRPNSYDKRIIKKELNKGFILLNNKPIIQKDESSKTKSNISTGRSVDKIPMVSIKPKIISPSNVCRNGLKTTVHKPKIINYNSNNNNYNIRSFKSFSGKKVNNAANEENKKLKKELGELKEKYNDLLERTKELAALMGMKFELDNKGQYILNHNIQQDSANNTLNSLDIDD